MKVYVVTPCLNVVTTVDRTIQSVISQAGDFELHYHVQDGGSTDGTREKLALWKERIERGAIPLGCRDLRFEYITESDNGMYDALARGIAASGARSDAFLTWINGDDLLMPGALAIAAEIARQFRPNEVSWFGGAVAVVRNDLPVDTHVRNLPTKAVGAGLCDGLHWDFVQQEGTFFRRWLWDAVIPAETIAPMRLAGDWNLWRLFAQKASLLQTPWPTGCFRIRPGQLSDARRAAYLAEIAALVAPEARRAALADLGESGVLFRRRLDVGYATGRLSVVEENVLEEARKRYIRVFGRVPTDWPMPQKGAAETHAVLVGKWLERPEKMVLQPGLAALDADWQYPAITERHSFTQLRARLPIEARGMAFTYVAYPWATLIDKLQNRTRDADDHLARFRQFCAHLPASGVRLTVCQHILLPRYLHLFAEAGISEVFWSHATQADIAASEKEGLQIHPFPLYPVQVPEALPEAGPEFDPKTVTARTYLFSFVGARDNAWYLTEVRSWIIDCLSAHPRGLIMGRDQWHYQRIVYDHQIRNTTSETRGLVDDIAAEQFRHLLRTSVFALCPSGSGANSIRLWEAIGAGAIPVILSDSWAPPGDRQLWAAAAVFCLETPDAVAALPDHLDAIARDSARLTAMRQALRQLWLLYGPQGFTYDVEKRIGALAEGNSTCYIEGSSDEAARHLLMWTGQLLLLRPDQPIPMMPEQVAAAKASLPSAHPSLLHLEHVLGVAAAHRTKGERHCDIAPADVVRLESPALRRASHHLTIHLFGRHGNRTPFSHQPLRRMAGDRVSIVDDPAEANILMTGFSIDLRENAAMLGTVMHRRQPPKVVVLSEEPIWDTVSSDGFTERWREVDCGGVTVPYAVLNHFTSDIFNFRHIPYFLLTSEDFAPRYAALIGRQAARSPREMLAHWRKTPLAAAFFAERCDDPRYAAEFPDLEVQGLSLYRTEVAQAVTGRLPAARVVCTGKGWGVEPPRQDLPDWHLDKLATLNNRVQIASAYENTHQKHYISEKIFDAFAVGGIPTYVARRSHRVLELIPEDAMLNDAGLTADEAATRIVGFAPNIALAEAWCTTARTLARLFARHDLLAEERRGVIDRCLAELDQINR